MLFPWLRSRVLGQPVKGDRAGPYWAAAMALGLAAVGTLFVLTRAGAAPPWPGLDRAAQAYQASFLRRMTAHHEVGVRLSELAVAKAEAPDLCVLGELMRAGQTSEAEVMRLWWRGWFGGEMPGATPGEHASMPGMPPVGTVGELASLEGCAFDEGFRPVMIAHHKGAIAMAGEALGRAADPRVRLLADAIVHAQGNQVMLMERMRCMPTAGAER